jgi:hypothetical protein
MRCGFSSVVGFQGGTCVVLPMRCHTWRCPRCGPVRRLAEEARIRAGLVPGETCLFTVTSPPDESPSASYQAFPRRWKRLHRTLVRLLGRFEYAAVVEPQRRGAAHVHVLARVAPPTTASLRHAALNAGFGRVVHVRPSHGGHPAYLGKGLTGPLADAPSHFRRVRYSRHWAPRPDTQWGRSWANWAVTDAPPPIVAAQLRARGYEVVDDPRRSIPRPER